MNLRSFKWIDAAGRPMIVASMTVAQRLKGADDRPRWAYRAMCDGQQVLLKVRPLTTLRARWRAMLGRSYLQREAVMLQRAAAAGVSVPVVVGRGAAWSFGLVTRQALMTQWLTGYRPLEDRVSHDADSSLAVMIAMLDQVRRAHLADKDFGIHNLLAAEQAGALHIVWADLERAYPAPADDADATCQTVGAALARWWVATSGHPTSLENAWKMMQNQLPMPRGGWGNILVPLNQFIADRLTKQIAIGRINRAAPPLLV